MMRKIVADGLWNNNPALVQLLGLCPLLAVSGTAINGLGMGLATLLVLTGSNITVSLIRHRVLKAIRIPVFVLVIAAFVTLVQLLMQAFTYELYQTLGIFIPLIVTNCLIIGRAEAFASRQPVKLAALDGAMHGLGFTAVLVVLGAIREVLGQGTLFDGAELLLGPWAQNLTLQLYQPEHPFLLAVLPPGAFLVMGVLIAAKNHINHLLEQRRQQQAPAQKAERARVTGNV